MGQDQPPASHDDYLVLYGLNEPEHGLPFAEAIAHLARQVNTWQQIVYLPKHELRAWGRKRRGSAIGLLQSRLGTDRAEELYLNCVPHPCSDLLRAAWPLAAAISYGDGIGVNYSPGYFRVRQPGETSMDMLSRASQADIARSPFPHLVLDQALDAALCRDLLASVPPLELLTRGARPGSNRRFDLAARDVAAEARLSPLWQQMIAQHVSQAFFDRFVELFAAEIVRAYPDFERRYGDPHKLRAGVRFVAGQERADVLLDALISVNTPVWGRPSSVRQAHLDSPHKLYTGLCYLRLDADDSTGGELELYSAPPPHTYDEGHHLIGGPVAVERTVPYRQGTLALFLNTPQALHGVSPRGVTPYPRLFINLNATLARPLFTVDMRRSWSRKMLTWPARKWRTVQRRLTRRPAKPVAKVAA